MEIAGVDLPGFVWLLLAGIGVSLLLTLLLGAWVVGRVRSIELPPGADFFTALQATPIAVVVLLDLLDLSLDIFSAPIAWTLLGYLGLQPLRKVTIVESLIPGTQLVPTMTLAWLVARYVGGQGGISAAETVMESADQTSPPEAD